MVQISRNLLNKVLSLTIFKVEVIGKEADYTLYDNEGYSFEKLTTEEGVELLKLKNDLKKKGYSEKHPFDDLFKEEYEN